MYEHEKLVDFNVTFLKIANSTSYSLGKRIFEEELVRKVVCQTDFL